MQNHGTHLFCHGAKNTQGALILVDIIFTRELGNIDILTTLTWKAQYLEDCGQWAVLSI